MYFCCVWFCLFVCLSIKKKKKRKIGRNFFDKTLFRSIFTRTQEEKQGERKTWSDNNNNNNNDDDDDDDVDVDAKDFVSVIRQKKRSNRKYS